MIIIDSGIQAIALAVVAIIPTTILAWATLRQSKINTKKQDATDVKTDQLVKKTDEIHILANSNLAKVNEQLQVANTKVDGLNLLVTAANSRIESLEKLIQALKPAATTEPPKIEP